MLSATFVPRKMKEFQRGIMLVVILLACFLPAKSQLNMDRVKNIFGSKKEASKVQTYLQYLSQNSLSKRTAGSTAEKKVTGYMRDQFSALLFKPYQGKFIHPFRIDKRNNLSEDSYIKIYNENLQVGADVIIPPFSGTGHFSAQALPGMPESENLWFIKFSEVGRELNNKRGNGLEKIYRKAKDAFKNGAESVMFLNDLGVTEDFTNSFVEQKSPLSKPVFLLNHAAYKKYILQKSRGQEWVNVDYDFSKTRRTLEGHNVIGYWQNQTPISVIICTRIDKLPARNANSSGAAALLDLADQINKTRLAKYNYILVGLSGSDRNHLGAESLIKKLRLNSNNVNCVVNIDDIGALDSKNEIFISGIETAPDWEMVMGSFTRNFRVGKIASPEVGTGNQMSFYKKQIPVINIFTKRKNRRLGNNARGIESVAASIGDMLLEIDKLPKFQFANVKPLPDTKKMNFKVSMGIVPDFAHAGTGLLIGTVRPNSPADYSMVRDGDILIKMGDYDIRDINDYLRELAKLKKGDRLMIKVNRNGIDKQMLITFR